MRDLVDEAVRGDAAERSRIRAVALAEPRLAARPIARDAGVSGVNVIVQLPGEDETLEGPLVVEFARDLASEVRERFPGIDVRMTGLVMMNNAFLESSQHDLKTLVPASFAVMALALALLTRGLSGTFATMLVVTLSIVTAMGLGGWAGFPLTPPTAAAPTIVLTVAIANCVHVLVTLLHCMQVDGFPLRRNDGELAIRTPHRSRGNGNDRNHAGCNPVIPARSGMKNIAGMLDIAGVPSFPRSLSPPSRGAGIHAMLVITPARVGDTRGGRCRT